MLVRAALSLLLAAPLVAQGSILVGPPGLGQTADLATAIDLAQDGSTVLVMAGEYGEASIDGRSLKVVAMPGSQVSVSKLLVRNLEPGDEVLLSGLSVVSSAGPGLTVSQCAGALRVEGCTMIGQSGPPGGSGPGLPGALVATSADVVFNDCILRGGIATHDSHLARPRGGTGLAVIDANVTVSGCNIDGGGGVYGGSGADAPHGGHGATLTDGFLFLSGSDVDGADGTEAWWNCDYSGDGGDGLVVDGAAEAWLLDSAPRRGEGADPPGCGFCGGCGEGFDGLDTRVLGPNASASSLPGSARTFQVPASVYEEVPASFTFTGLPGETVHLMRGDAYGFRFVPGLGGVLSLEPPAVVQFAPLGVVDASGVLAVDFQPPTIATGTVSLLRQQVFLRGPGGARRLGHAASLSVVSCFVGPDCDGNGMSDLCELADGILADCNGNGLPDTCDILAGYELDLDGNGVPDSCDGYMRIHVDASMPTINGDGTSWANAFQSLLSALAAAEVAANAGTPRIDIWVAAGTYRPTEAPWDSDATFEVPARTWLYGGFAGDELDLAARDVEGNTTLLSGDVLGDDGPGFTNRGDNVRNIVSFAGGEGGGLDGFRLRGAHGTNPARGGAVWVDQTSAVVRQCHFLDNSDLYGGGLSATLIAGNQLVVFGCTFEANRAILRGGGCNIVGAGGTADVAHSVFRRNRAPRASALAGQAVSVVGCLFHDNVASDGLGALELGPLTALPSTVAQCTFANNAGRGMYVDATAFVHNSVFWDNAEAGVENESTQILLGANASLTLEYTTIEGLATFTGPGLSGFNPVFLDPDGIDGESGTADDNYRLGPGSPAVDSGANTLLPDDTFDLDGDGNTTEKWSRDLNGVPRRLDDPNVPDTGAGNAPLVDRGPFERASS